MNTKTILAIAMATILPFAMSGVGDAFASSYVATDSVKSNTSLYWDHLDICGTTNTVKYSISTVYNTSRTLAWDEAPSSITCYGETVSLTKVVAEFKKHNSSPLVFTIDDPQTTTSATNNNEATYNGGTKITLTYS